MCWPQELALEFNSQIHFIALLLWLTGKRARGFVKMITFYPTLEYVALNPGNIWTWHIIMRTLTQIKFGKETGTNINCIH